MHTSALGSGRGLAKASFSPGHRWRDGGVSTGVFRSLGGSSWGTAQSLSRQYSQHVVLNMQFMSDGATKACVRAGWLVVLLSAALMIWEIVNKFTIAPRHYLMTNTLAIKNVSAASLCCAALLAAALAYAAGIVQAARATKVWAPLQKRVVAFVGLQLGLQFVNVVFYLAPNALLLARPCSWYLLPNDIFTFIRWTCWSALFFLLVVQAHAMLPARYVLGSHPAMLGKWIFGTRWPIPESGTEGLMAYDLPLWVHTPLVLLLWLPTQVTILLFLLWLTGVLGSRVVCTSLWRTGCYPAGASPDMPCTQWGWTCDIGSQAIYYALTAVMGSMILLMLAAYFVLMRIVQRELNAMPYSRFRMANLAVRFQTQVQSVLAALFVVGIIFGWYVEVDGCNGFISAWFGLPSMQLMMSCIVVLNVVTTIPVAPSPHQLFLHQSLQRTVWREDSAQEAPPVKQPSGHVSASSARSLTAQDGGASSADLEAGAQAAGVDGKEEWQADAPMLCFETALKALYWAKLAYVYQEEEEEESRACNLDTALGLFRLEHHLLLWDREPTDAQLRRTDTKCLMAWGRGTVAVCFRGTASLANVMADLRAWRTVHPPRRGSLLNPPKVHAGFWEAYTAERHNVQILERLRVILNSGGGSMPSTAKANGGAKEGGGEEDGGKTCDSGSGSSVPLRQWRVIYIGHSLGGALATLAAYDAAKEAQRLQRRGWDVKVQLVTFGAPRPGNHAFAREFIQMVPDSWDVVHSNDIVAKEAKFVFMFKRAANRVIVSPAGDILPRPSFLEHTLHRGTSSLRAHYLANYARSFAAVIRGQFKSKATDRTSRQMLRELASCQYVKEMLTGLLTFRQQTLWRLRYGVLHNTVGLDMAPQQGLLSFESDPISAALPESKDGEMSDLEEGEVTSGLISEEGMVEATTCGQWEEK